MRHTVRKISVFILLLFVLLYGLENLLFDTWRNYTKGDGPLSKINQVLLHQLDYPVTFWGASTTWVHFNPALIDSLAGVNSYNMGLNGTSLQQYKGILHEYLSYTTQSKLLVLGLHVSSLSSRNELYNPRFFYLHGQNPSLIKGIESIDPVLAMKLRYVPFYQLTCYHLEDFGKLDDFAYSKKGYFPNPRYAFKQVAASPSLVPIEKDRLAEVREVVRMCKQKDIVPVVCMVPYYKPSQDLIENLGVLQDSLRALEKDGAVYMDFLDHPVCREKKYFYNSTHMNDKGANIFSAAFAEKLKHLLH